MEFLGLRRFYYSSALSAPVIAVDDSVLSRGDSRFRWSEIYEAVPPAVEEMLVVDAPLAGFQEVKV